MPKKIYKRFLILLRIIFSMIKTSFRNKKVWTTSYKLSPKSSFSILLSFDCHATKNEPRNAVNSSFLGSCTSFKLFFGFDFSCYLIVIAFQNRIILIRFCILLMWFQSCCTQIVPKHFPSSLQQQFIYIFFYFRF